MKLITKEKNSEPEVRYSSAYFERVRSPLAHQYARILLGPSYCGENHWSAEDFAKRSGLPKNEQIQAQKAACEEFMKRRDYYRAQDVAIVYDLESWRYNDAFWKETIKPRNLFPLLGSVVRDAPRAFVEQTPLDIAKGLKEMVQFGWWELKNWLRS
jgi:hypothetical protein